MEPKVIHATTDTPTWNVYTSRIVGVRESIQGIRPPHSHVTSWCCSDWYPTEYSYACICVGWFWPKFRPLTVPRNKTSLHSGCTLMLDHIDVHTHTLSNWGIRIYFMWVCARVFAPSLNSVEAFQSLQVVWVQYLCSILNKPCIYNKMTMNGRNCISRRSLSLRQYWTNCCREQRLRALFLNLQHQIICGVG